jgi:hypothetical protein
MMISSLRVVRNFTPASDCGFVNGPQASGVTLAIDGQEIFTEFLGSCDVWCHKRRGRLGCTVAAERRKRTRDNADQRLNVEVDR